MTTLLVSAADNTSLSQPEQVIQNGFSFATQHKEDTKFEAEEAVRLVDALTEIGKNSKNSIRSRSNAYVAIAKISWRIADKFRLKGGAEYGRNAIAAIKESLEVDPNNKDAAIAYSRTISDMVTQSFAVRKILSSKLAISLDKEAEIVIDHLDRLKLTATADYPILKKYLD